LVVVSILFFVLSEVILGPGPDYNMALAYASTAVVASIAVAAFVTELISITRSKERSILVFIAMAVSLYSLIGGMLHCLAWQSNESWIPRTHRHNKGTSSSLIPYNYFKIHP
jgi:predicted membrane channel-forming protein YqfA (hemolysin III family)